MEDDKFFRCNRSPCVLTTLLVPRKVRSYRTCIDSQVINKITIKYPSLA